MILIHSCSKEASYTCHWFQNLNGGNFLDLGFVLVMTVTLWYVFLLSSWLISVVFVITSLLPKIYKWNRALWSMSGNLLRWEQVVEISFSENRDTEMTKSLLWKSTGVLPTLNSQRAKSVSIAGPSAGNNSKLWIQVFQPVLKTPSLQTVRWDFIFHYFLVCASEAYLFSVTRMHMFLWCPFHIDIHILSDHKLDLSVCCKYRLNFYLELDILLSESRSAS